MALKDWERFNLGNIGNTYDIIEWQKKGQPHTPRNSIELFRAENIDGKMEWIVNIGEIGRTKFQTRGQALNYAMNYMRTH